MQVSKQAFFFISVFEKCFLLFEKIYFICTELGHYRSLPDAVEYRNGSRSIIVNRDLFVY